MTPRRFSWTLLLLLLSGCGDGTPSTPTSTQATVLATFSDGAGFSTTDVRDSDDQIMRFDTANDTLLWTPSNLVFDGWRVSGNFLDEARLYEVRFGTVSGQKRAYFTEAGRGTLCDLEVGADRILRISPTDVFPPAS